MRMRKLSIHELHSVGGGNTEEESWDSVIADLRAHSEIPMIPAGMAATWEITRELGPWISTAATVR